MRRKEIEKSQLEEIRKEWIRYGFDRDHKLLQKIEVSNKAFNIFKYFILNYLLQRPKYPMNDEDEILEAEFD